MSRVLVTGASGLIGRHAVAGLRALGHEVHAVSRLPPGPRGGDVAWHTADLLDPASVRRVVAEARAEQLLHLGWVTDHGRFWTAPENGAWLDASIELITAFAAAGGKRVVAAGTCAEYDWQHPDVASGACDEVTTPLATRTPYAASKVALLSWIARHAAVSWAWGRVFHVFGEGEDPRRLVPSVARALLAGEDARLGPGDVVRDFTYAGDVGDAFVALLRSTAEGPVNVASGEAVSIEQLSASIARIAGPRGRVLLGALPPREGDPPRLVASVRRLRGEARFTPRSGLEAGLRRAVSFWSARQERRGDG